MLRIGIMTESITKYKDIISGLDYIKDLGFECADITLNKTNFPKEMNPYFDNDHKLKAEELKKHADEINLPLVQAHAPFPVYIVGDDEYNKKQFSNLIKCIEICSVLGIKNLVMHPIYNLSILDNYKFFNKLLPYAKENNVVICAENLWDWDSEKDIAKECTCSSPESLKALVDLISDKSFKACIDIGHANMFKSYNFGIKDMIETLNVNVYCLHIHDNNGRYDEHLIPFDGSIDFSEVIKSLNNINYNYDLMTECLVVKGSESFIDATLKFKKICLSIKKIKDCIISNRNK